MLFLILLYLHHFLLWYGFIELRVLLKERTYHPQVLASLAVQLNIQRLTLRRQRLILKNDSLFTSLCW